jgi:hypothetical protein
MIYHFLGVHPLGGSKSLGRRKPFVRFTSYRINICLMSACSLQ